MNDIITGFCKNTGKEQTLSRQGNDIQANTFENNVTLKGRYECDNKFCAYSECPLLQNQSN